MSRGESSDDCPDCRPTLFDINTGMVYPPGSPEMDVVDRVWSETTLMERMAFHSVTCLNSRSPLDLAIVRPVMKKIEIGIQTLKKASP